MQAMTAEPSDLIQRIATAVIIEQDFHHRIPRKKLLLKLLSEKFGPSDHHRLMLLTRPEIDQTKLRKTLAQHTRFEIHRRVMRMACQKMRQDLIHRNFRAPA